MERFELRREHTAEEAVRSLQQAAASAGGVPRRMPLYIAGGTNVVDYMTLHVLQPGVLVDLNLLPRKYAVIENHAKGLRLGALVRMADAEDHPQIRTHYPVLQQSLQLAASSQIRNMASLGGNLLQRTRCEYYREPSWPCNKRNPGSGCAALEGYNRQHAVLGTSPQCIAAYAGDFAQALIALDAAVETIGAAAGPRRIPLGQLHRRPGNTPHVETSLEPGELITFIEVPAGPWTRRSRFLKVRDRKSYQFALASAAVALHLDGDTVQEARIALGGVSSVPWRAHEAEAVLKGRRLDQALATQAAEAAFAQAQPRRHNAFKVPLGRQTLVRALLETQAMRISA